MSTNNQFYICEEYYLLIYETKAGAIKAVDAVICRADHPRANMAMLMEAQVFSKRLNLRVSYSQPNEPIFLIKAEEFYWNVIIGERVGWISVRDWHKIKKLEK